MTDDQRDLVTRNLPLAWHIAHRVYRFGRARHEPIEATLEDLQQDAMVGLCRAAQGYDPSRRTSFSTYAYPVISNYLKDTIRKHRLITHPRATRSRRNYREQIDITSYLISFDYEMDRIGPDPPVWLECATREERALLLRLLLRLRREDRRACRVLILRHQGMTMQAIGTILGCTKQRVEQIEKEAIAWLREMWRAKNPSR